MRRRWLVTRTVCGVLALGARRAWAQPAPAAPSAPSAPGTPRAPGRPSAPGTPDGARLHELAEVLLLVDTRGGTVESLVLRLGDALVRVVPPGHGRDRGDLALLAGLLAGGLGKGTLAPADSERLSEALAGALGTETAAQRDVARALAEVRAALLAAGVGADAILLIEREVRGLARPR